MTPPFAGQDGGAVEAASGSNSIGVPVRNHRRRIPWPQGWITGWQSAGQAC